MATDYKDLHFTQDGAALERAAALLLAMPPARPPKGRRFLACEQPSGDEREVKFALQYLDAFGYLSQALAGWQDITLADILKALKQFQELFGLPLTKRLDSHTVHAMEMPRCGQPDKPRRHHVQALRVRKWVAHMKAEWTKRSLCYFIADRIPGLAPSAFDYTVAAAFADWTELAPIEVTDTNDPDKADIIISTGEGPRSNFDGPGGVLAWAYLPDGNDQQLTMKFDLSETWVMLPEGRGICLKNVATHEFGHLFGLGHSSVTGALMAPYYNAAVATPQQFDDVPQFTGRYGHRTPPPPEAG